MIYIIDRFEGDFAVCETENGHMMNLLKGLIPKEAKEGDVLVLKDGELKIDNESTENMKKLVEEITKNLWKE